MENDEIKSLTFELRKSICSVWFLKNGVEKHGYKWSFHKANENSLNGFSSQKNCFDLKCQETNITSDLSKIMRIYGIFTLIWYFLPSKHILPVFS